MLASRAGIALAVACLLSDHVVRQVRHGHRAYIRIYAAAQRQKSIAARDTSGMSELRRPIEAIWDPWTMQRYAPAQRA